MAFDAARCRLCPRRCGADRTRSRGLCGAGDTLLAARAALHPWEEPCISGTRGSGTVFFSGCPLHCCFCQNAVISAACKGKPVSQERLGEIFLSLQAQGAHNINLVTAGHFLPWIVPVLERIKPSLHIPVVYNCGGYESPEQLQMLNGLVEIYLPDFKFLDPQTAARYADAPDYPEVAFAALEEMLRQTGPPVITQGLMERGCIVRHLVLPGCRHESIALLEALAGRFGTGRFLLSLMAQYTPEFAPSSHPVLGRRLTKMEYGSVLKTAQALGFDGYLQDVSAARTEYTPDFSMQGL
ncbi:MAG: radical SAM protein [Oscillospiraceae bacterium]|nr:radical SAM protein [Oscillospiraceae bacterium]